ncbi:MAG TPA: hypothetical protein VMY42_09575 [Thermoguttaceae bacterium]|nr:hypothetical protein [Thermoguttaceae bacterium]
MAWRDDYPQTDYFAQKHRKGVGLLLCVHVARVKMSGAEALVTLHADDDCGLAFSFITSAETARDQAMLGTLLERQYSFRLKATPADCTHARCPEERETTRTKSPVGAGRRAGGFIARSLAGRWGPSPWGGARATPPAI